jgi:hypothetical protein
MSRKDDIFTRLRLGLALFARNAAPNLFRYPPRAIEPIDLRLGHLGTHPGHARITVEVGGGRLGSGTMARAAGFHPRVAGSLSRATGIISGLGEIRLEPVRSAVN